ncbi:MAG: hypothetical protein HQ522_03160 [Bacteroidetes bacterium]|nr:hypothetical protein [Bacteroidota bacterium]
MKKYIKYILLVIVGITYGILMEKHEIFPHELLESIHDYFAEEEETVDAIHTDIVFPEINLQNLLSVNPNNSDSLRTELNELVFGTSDLPGLLPEKVYRVEDDSYADVSNLEYIEQFEISQKYDIKSIGYIFHPEVSNNRLMLYHQGHRGDFINGKETFKHFLKEGFTIYAFCMPLLGKNNQPVIELEKLGAIPFNNHERFKYLENPIQYFITPIVSMINYSENKKFDDVTMIGISGGGWTTTLTAAADSRINYSFPIAGTYPMFIRLEKPKKNYGDFEQTYEQLYSKINYLDMYVLGSVGENRFQVQILNEFDPCCFDGDDFNRYASFVSSKVEKFNSGRFDLFSDFTHKEHQISEVALLEISKNLKSTPEK